MAVSPLSRRPLYLQVSDLLSRRIFDGEWKPGAAIPNEHDLAQELGVSTGTVRKALGELVVGRIVTRRQGRGTFVTDQEAGGVRDPFDNIDMGNGASGAGATQLLEQTNAAASQVEQDRLGLAAGECVLRTKRLRSQDGEPFMFEMASLALSRLPRLSGGAPQDYHITALAQRCGVRLGRATERLTLAEAPAEPASCLGVEPGAPLLRLDRIVLRTDGSPLEWRIGYCHFRNQAYVAEMG